MQSNVIINAITENIILFKWALCSFGEEIQTQNFNVYNVNEVKNTTLEIFIVRRTE